MTGFIHCNLRVLMAERGLNIQNVKDQTTLSRTTISNLFNNYGSGVQFDTLIQLCTLLKCTPGDLFTFVNINVSFEDLTTDIKTETVTDVYITDPSEGEGYEYISEIKASFTIKFKLKYEDKTLNFNFCVDTISKIDEQKNIVNTLTDTQEIYQSQLNSLKAPIYVSDHINEKLDQFLYERINDLVKSTEL